MMQQRYAAACFVSWLRFLSPFGGCAPVYLLDLALLGLPFVRCDSLLKSYNISYSTFLLLLHRTRFCIFFYTPRRWAYRRRCSSPTLDGVVVGCWVRVASVCGLVMRYQQLWSCLTATNSFTPTFLMCFCVPLFMTHLWRKVLSKDGDLMFTVAVRN